MSYSNEILKHCIDRHLNKGQLVQESVFDGASICQDGQVHVLTGSHTGRAAKDKYILDDPNVDVEFGEAGKPISIENFSKLKDFIDKKTYGMEVYVNDVSAGGIKVRLITSSPTHSLFLLNMFEESDSSKEPDLTIIALPHTYPEGHHKTEMGVSSPTFIAMDISDGLVLICGTQYAGEVKKSIFSYLSYKLPEENILPMHSSVTTDRYGENSAVFFGLSGTGKTTLSADPKRKLVGDDEHGWSDEGLFNFEAGCYAKLIKLSEENEPLIWSAVHSFGTLIENVYLSKESILDFDSSKYTENTRGAYPLSKIENAHVPGFVAPMPKNIIMLTCDAYGVLPSVAKLTPEGAAYHFISGYTAKVAGTEKGVTEPVATFSALFGAPFMPRNVNTYADMLVHKIQVHKPDVWLVNTGWVGGGPGVGNRIDLPTTRRIVNSILDGTLKKSVFAHNGNFNLDVPENMPYVFPMQEWLGNAAYMKASDELVKKFNENADRFNLSDNILKAGMPR